MSARQQIPERETCDRRFLTYKVKVQGNDVKTQEHTLYHFTSGKDGVMSSLHNHKIKKMSSLCIILLPNENIRFLTNMLCKIK